MKHTKGPWSIDNVFIVNSEDELIAQIDPVHENDISVYMRNTKEARANAKLIASAPELLEACKNIDRFFYGENGHTWRGELNMKGILEYASKISISIAIAKAEEKET